MDELDKDILRRILFAVEYLPCDCPNYWKAVAKFAALGSSSSVVLNAQDIQVYVENLQLLHERAFATDSLLMKELHAMSHGEAQPLRIFHPKKIVKYVEGNCYFEETDQVEWLCTPSHREQC